MLQPALKHCGTLQQTGLGEEKIVIDVAIPVGQTPVSPMLFLLLEIREFCFAKSPRPKVWFISK
jgi:hypothetical protein